MPTIYTDQPSTGKPVPIRVSKLEPGDNVVYEAPNFNIPIREEEGEVLLVQGIERQLVPGEALFIMPLNIANNSGALGGAEVYVHIEPEVISGGALPPRVVFASQVFIPPLETVQIPINGLSLLRSGDVDSTSGDKLVVGVAGENAADTNLALYTLASEAEAGTHAPEIELPSELIP
jgi:hypothetical protein